MVIVLGGSGYVGRAICRALERADVDYQSLSRKHVDYTNPHTLRSFLREASPKFLINAAGYTGKPNVDACEHHRAECLQANAVLPGLIRQACEDMELPWGHISSGCIYSGSDPNGSGFRESDPPNFCFRTDNCSFYSGTKALGEECLDGAENVFVWRLRIPFGNVDGDRNYLSKLLRYERLLNVRNSLTDLDEFADACWKCWEKRIPFGTYHMTNPGSVTTKEVVDVLSRKLTSREFHFFENEEQFMREAAVAPRSSCVLDTSKLRNCGIEMSHVGIAIDRAIQNWSR